MNDVECVVECSDSVTDGIDGLQMKPLGEEVHSSLVVGEWCRKVQVMTMELINEFHNAIVGIHGSIEGM